MEAGMERAVICLFYENILIVSLGRDTTQADRGQGPHGSMDSCHKQSFEIPRNPKGFRMSVCVFKLRERT